MMENRLVGRSRQIDIQNPSDVRWTVIDNSDKNNPIVISDQNKTSLVESIGLFGIRKASSSKEEHGGAGLNIIVDITDYFDELHLNKQIVLKQMDNYFL